MATIKLLDINGNAKGNISIDESLFEKKPHKQAIFDSVISENASTRQGTHSTLTKGEVRGGGKKPWRQKHTGKARTGTTRNPHWVGGGVVFGPKPNRNYMKKVNKKIYSLAYRSALKIKLNDENLFGLEDKANLNKPCTKEMVKFIKNAKLENKKILLVLNENDNIKLSSNNIPKVTAKKWNQVSVKDLIHTNIVIVQEGSFAKIKEVYA